MIQFIKLKESKHTVDYFKYLKISKDFIETIDDKIELYRYLALYTWYNKYILGDEKCFPYPNDILHQISLSNFEMILLDVDIVYDDMILYKIVLLDKNEKLPYLILNLIDKCRAFNENKLLTNN